MATEDAAAAYEARNFLRDISDDPGWLPKPVRPGIYTASSLRGTYLTFSDKPHRNKFVSALRDLLGENQFKRMWIRGGEDRATSGRGRRTLLCYSFPSPEIIAAIVADFPPNERAPEVVRVVRTKKARIKPTFPDMRRQVIEFLAHAANGKLTHAQAAAYIGHKGPWVTRLLAWREAGYPAGGVFGPEIAARRANSSTSNTQKVTAAAVDPPPLASQSEAARTIIATRRMAVQFMKTCQSLGNEGAMLPRSWLPGENMRTELQQLVVELERAVRMGGIALDGVKTTLAELDSKEPRPSSSQPLPAWLQTAVPNHVPGRPLRAKRAR